jgi:hypothetical protein
METDERQADQSFQADKPTSSGLTPSETEFVPILFGGERNPRHEEDCRYRGWRWGRVLVQRLRRRCPCAGSRALAPVEMLENCADERRLCNRRDDAHWPGASRGQTLKSVANTRALLAAPIDGRPPFAKQKTTFSQDGKVAAIDPDFESRP